MTNQPSQPNPPLATQPPVFGSFGLRAVWIITLSTLAIFLIFLTSGRIKLSESALEIVSALVYTTSIALPSIFLLTKLTIVCSPRYPRWVLPIQALILICTATFGTIVGAFVLVVVGISHPGFYWHDVLHEAPFCITIALLFGLSISSFETLRYKYQAASLALRTQQVEQERAYKLLAEARLSALESRIHPHFLFNTLNSIAALIPSDPARAEQTVGNLASLLRFSLNAHHSGLVPLTQELKILRDYLEIEKTRFGPRLRYEINIPPEIAEVKVPPLALQSLAENVVKHVISQRQQGASIEVTGHQEADRITLEVIDDGPGFSLESIAPEHGLGNLITRMELLYGTAGQLEVAHDNGKTAVRLTFPA